VFTRSARAGATARGLRKPHSTIKQTTNIAADRENNNNPMTDSWMDVPW
jgi:hypothetical protein